jgi:two-component sensor histidine kinase
MTDTLKIAAKIAKPNIPNSLIAKWQKVVDNLAHILEVPAALIMKVDGTHIEVFVTSRSDGNPYDHGEQESLGRGLYCERVMKDKAPLLVPQALKDPEWRENPDIKLGMVYYQGLPLLWPDGEVFGTICVLDRDNNPRATEYKTLLGQFQDILNSDLDHLFESVLNEHVQREIIVREVHHRLKNQLQGISGLLALETKKHPALEPLLHSAIRKIDTISQTFGIQAGSFNANSSLQKMIKIISESLTNSYGNTIETTLDLSETGSWEVAREHAVPIALVVNELLTNAIKHHSREDEAIHLNLDESPSGVEIIIQNEGQLDGNIDFSARQGLGFGLRLIHALLPKSGVGLSLTQTGKDVRALLSLQPPAIVDAV